jgi:hypothetical protein
MIESANGIYQQSFKAVKECVNNRLPHIMGNFKKASAFINFYKKRLISDEYKQLEIAQKMKALLTPKRTI